MLTIIDVGQQHHFQQPNLQSSSNIKPLVSNASVLGVFTCLLHLSAYHQWVEANHPTMRQKGPEGKIQCLVKLNQQKEGSC